MGRPRVYSDSCQDGTRLPPTTTMRTLLREAYHFYTPLLISINSPELVVVLQRYRDMLYEKGFVTPNKIYLVGQPLFIPGIAMDMNYTPQKMVDSMLQRTPKVQSPYPEQNLLVIRIAMRRLTHPYLRTPSCILLFHKTCHLSLDHLQHLDYLFRDLT